MKLDLQSGKESVIYVSREDKLWPLPSARGNEVAFESRLGDQTSIVLLRGSKARTLCTGCSHPGAWISDGRELLYTTRNGSIAILDVDSGKSTQVIAADHQYTLSNPDWNPATQHILFTAIKDGTPQIFTAGLTKNPAYAASSWTALSANSDDADLARWSEDGLHFYYFSRSDGSYCIWGNSFNPQRNTIGTAFPVQHYHDWGKSPRLAFAYLRGLSVANGSIYVNVGEESSTVWMGSLRSNSLFTYFQRVFQ
jgi:WD40 repeat protein